MRARGWFGAIGVAVAAFTAAPAWAAWPEFVIEVGNSFGVDGSIEQLQAEDPELGVRVHVEDGGFNVGLSALWPVVERVRFGVRGFVTDVGSIQGDFQDANDPAVSVGTVELAHIDAYGVAWRAEVQGPAWKRVSTFATGDLGLYRLEADQYGEVFGATSKLGWALGAGVTMPVGTRYSLGATARFDRVFDDFTRYWMSAALEWRWRPAGG